MPVFKALQVDLGYKNTFINALTRNDFEQIVQGRTIKDPELNKQFSYQENIHAFYTQGIFKRGLFTIQGGIRVENTKTFANDISKNENLERQYLKLFPNLQLSKQTDKGNRMQISFSKRLDRPNYGEINPTIHFASPILYYQGNPFLSPIYTQSINMEYSIKKWLFGASYSVLKDDIIWMTSQNDSTRVQRSSHTNIEKSFNYNAFLFYTKAFTSSWNASLNINAYYNSYDFTHKSIRYYCTLTNGFQHPNGICCTNGFENGKIFV